MLDTLWKSFEALNLKEKRKSLFLIFEFIDINHDDTAFEQKLSEKQLEDEQKKLSNFLF